MKSSHIVSPRAGGLLLILSFIGFIALGLPDAVIGVAWPALQIHFAVPVDALGLFYIAATAGAVIASSLSGAILARWNVGHLLAASCLLTAVSLVGYVFAPNWLAFVTAGVFAGLGAGAIDSGINTYAAENYSPRVVNVLHAFYGIGAAAGPALMTAMLVGNRGWQSGYAVIICIEALLAIAFFMTRSRWTTSSTGHEPRSLSLWQTARLPRTRVSLLIFFVYTGCEAAAGAWIFSLLLEARHFTTSAAGAAATLYWCGLSASRLAYALLPHATNPRQVVRACLLVALLSAGVLSIDLGPTINVIAIAALGFASGPIFPSLIATTPQRMGSVHAANAIGLQISAASVGLAALPAACGVIAARLGLDAIPTALSICWVVLALTYFLLDRGQ